jgi:phosphoribosylanthranilate isomerase
MIVQIYTAQSVDEALELARLGVDQIGVTPARRGLPGEIDTPLAAEIVAALAAAAHHPVISVALSVEAGLDEIERMARQVRPDILHLCGDIQKVPPAAVGELRRWLLGQKIMQAIPVEGPQSVEIALSFQDVADLLILDSKSAAIDGIGAAGFTHDWTVSREIVRKVHVPVILAGGLSSENVAEAIHTVQPWGVDSLTHTNRLLPGGGFCKDLERVKAFVQVAKKEA